MAQPTTRQEFIDWCLRSLGHPVITINVDDEQVDDRVDEALEYWRTFHHDAVLKVYYPYEITQNVIDERAITVSNTFVGVTRLLPLSSATGYTSNIFDMAYQMRLNDYLLYRTSNTLDVFLLNQYMTTLDQVFNGQTIIDFNKKINKVFPRWNWDTDAVLGNYVVVEGLIYLDETAYPNIWKDRYLQALATAYIKRQWGSNLKKFEGVKLLGGMTYNGQQIYDEAIATAEKIEANIRSEAEEPPIFITG